MEKTKKSVKNVFMTFFSSFISIAIGLISQKLFIKILGIDYAGINGLFNNIISLLSIAELGIGTAIIYSLYKPIEKKDKETIKTLINFYKKAYNVIAIIILFLGLIIMPFIKFFIKEITIEINIYIIFFMFLLDTVFSYLLTYKRSMLYATQNNYIINIIHMVYLILLNAFQLLFLYITKSYYVYLTIKIVMRLLENVVINIYTNKKYPFLLDKDINNIDNSLKNDIIKRTKALMYHKIGGFIVNGTDNIIISKFLGLTISGLYSNYYLVTNAVSSLFGQAITALTPSVGFLLLENNSNKSFEIFKRVRFITFWISCFSAIAILLLIQPFIKIWFGEKYLLSISTVIVIVINYFQKSMRNAYITFKEAGGIFIEDKYVPLIESTINIITSIILVKLIGLPGVFLGTIISGLVLWMYSYPKFVYIKIFKRNVKQYIKETIGYIILFLILAMMSLIITVFVSKYINNIFIELIINMLICLLMPNISIVILFRKSDNFKYTMNLCKKLLGGLYKRG